MDDSFFNRNLHKSSDDEFEQIQNNHKTAVFNNPAGPRTLSLSEIVEDKSTSRHQSKNSRSRYSPDNGQVNKSSATTYEGKSFLGEKMQ